MEEAVFVGLLNIFFFAIEGWQVRDFCALGNSTDGKHFRV